MPRRDIEEIMQPKETRHVERMKNLMETPRVVEPPKKQVIVKKTLKGTNNYAILGVDAASIDVILDAVKLLDGNVGNNLGPPPEIIGGSSMHQYQWRIGPVEHHAIKLARTGKTMQKLPEGCPDPVNLARVIIQQWYAQWGPELEQATGLKPE